MAPCGTSSPDWRITKPQSFRCERMSVGLGERALLCLGTLSSLWELHDGQTLDSCAWARRIVGVRKS